MAKINLKLLLQEEGGYANHPNDTGGETYAGVARNYHPRWSGWAIVDKYKKIATNHNGVLNKKELNALLGGQMEVEREIEKFYISEFWNKIRGNEIVNDKVAANIFDFAVNAGVKRAIKAAQAALGLKQDGVIGPITLTAINRTSAADFVGLYASRRERFYRTLVSLNSKNKVFLANWLSRTERMKNV